MVAGKQARYLVAQPYEVLGARQLAKFNVRADLAGFQNMTQVAGKAVNPGKAGKK